MENCRITIILPTIVTGSKGTKLPFMPYNQYCYVEKGMYERECFEPECSPIGVYDYPGYIIEINEELFLLWKDNVIEENEERTEDEKLPIGKWYRKHITDDLRDKDYKKTAKEVLGIDVKKHERTDYNGRWLEKLLP